MLDAIFTGLDEKRFVVAAFVDFSKAFDTINHLILTNKLRSLYNFGPSAINVVANYLQNRTFQVKYDNQLSHPKGLKTGVPQGSKLGPLFYLIYVNDVYCYIAKYAQLS